MAKTRLIIVVVAVLLLGGIALGARGVNAQSTQMDSNGQSASPDSTTYGNAPPTGCDSTVPAATRTIWRGLWAGINLDFSRLLSGSGNSDATQDGAQTDGCGDTSSSPPSSIPQDGGTSQSGGAAPSITPASGGGRYVALGDSVAAGAGLPLVANATPTDRACQRSNQAYPYLVAQARGLQLTQAACSGATAGDLETSQDLSGAPDARRQISAVFDNGTPQLVTVTAGANDVHWSQLIYQCYKMTCGGTADTRLVDASLVLLRAKLLAFFSEMRLRGGGQTPTTVVTGYYDPLSSACLTQTATITPAELQWIGASADALNQTIREAAAGYSFVRFVPIDFSGHDLCSGDSWVQGMQDPVPLHPTAAGQQAIASSVLTALGQ